MDNSKETSLKIPNRFIVYVKKIEEYQYGEYKEEAINTIDPSDSFSFFMSLEKLDSSFGDLNKAFVLMMKEVDAKLNYIIDILRDKEYQKKLDQFTKAYSCEIFKEGLSFSCHETYNQNDTVFLKFILPIANHYEIKTISKITKKEQKNDKLCYEALFKEIKGIDLELIIHYMLFCERKILKEKGFNL